MFHWMGLLSNVLLLAGLATTAEGVTSGGWCLFCLSQGALTGYV